MLTAILILLPIACALMVTAMRDPQGIRRFALLATLAELGVAVAAFVQYQTSCHCNLLIAAPWLNNLGITMRFSLDGLSLVLVLLTVFLMPVIAGVSMLRNYERPAAFYSLLLLMEGALVGVFTANDGLMFYIFWELTLIPAYFISALWGGSNRIRITLKFFIYTFTGSLFMLVALIWLYLRTPAPHTFAMEWLYGLKLSGPEQAWIFAAFFVAFAIKIPIFPFHTWQPDTYTASPAPGSMLLAGLMLKMGLFGMIRWMIPLVPDAVAHHATLVTVLAVTGIVYASIIALTQRDMKRVAAYSSIAHVGLIAAGIFALTPQALQGAVFQMLAHGVNIVGLFAVIEMIELRTGSRNMGDFGGLARRMPILATFFMVILMASVALPLTNSFIGEFLLLLGIFQASAVAAAFAGLTVIFSAVYMLRMYQRTMLGPVEGLSDEAGDLTWREMAVLIPIVVAIFAAGLAPKPLIDLFGGEMAQLLLTIK